MTLHTRQQFIKELWNANSAFHIERILDKYDAEIKRVLALKEDECITGTCTEADYTVCSERGCIKKEGCSWC